MKPNDTLRRTLVAFAVAAVVPACGYNGSNSDPAAEQQTQTDQTGSDQAELVTAEDEDPIERYADLDNPEPGADEANEAPLPLEPEPAEVGENAEALATDTEDDDGIGTSAQALSTTTSDRVTFTNARGERVIARWFLPAGSSTTKHPAIILLHGSGGMHKMPSSADKSAGRICSNDMESQFPRWAKRLTAAGYAVLIPDSWQTRGYCDESGDSRRSKAYPSNSSDSNGKTRRLLGRIYDTDASARWLANHARVKADSIALLGFSNGGSAVMTALHRDLNGMLSRFAATTRGRNLKVAIPQLPNLFPYQRGIAYYPGCGFDHLLTTSTDTGNLSQFYYPRKPLRILIGSKDSLLEHCSIKADGEREIQADTYAAKKGLPDRYTIKVFSGAGHSYDGAGCEKSGANFSNPDIVACDTSRKTTMSLLSTMPR